MASADELLTGQPLRTQVGKGRGGARTFPREVIRHLEDALKRQREGLAPDFTSALRQVLHLEPTNPIPGISPAPTTPPVELMTALGTVEQTTQAGIEGLADLLATVLGELKSAHAKIDQLQADLTEFRQAAGVD